MKQSYARGRGVATVGSWVLLLWWAVVLVVLATTTPVIQAFTSPTTSATLRLSSQLYMAAPGGREAEIRRKINQLKRQGKLERNDEDDDGDDDYSEKIRAKMGAGKSKLLGYTDDDDLNDEEEENLSEHEQAMKDVVNKGDRQAEIGTLSTDNNEEDQDEPTGYQPPVDISAEIGADIAAFKQATANASKTKPLIDPALFDDPDAAMEELMEEEELIDMVAKKMQENRLFNDEEEEAERKIRAVDRLAALKEEREQEKAARAARQQESTQLTSGIGGSWAENTTAVEEMHAPKVGSWGVFPRPKDISKAYGGGRRIGTGYSDESSSFKSAEETRTRLQQYREKSGIDVQSEKDHADEIQEALKISSLAMQRGVYSTAVSALEKVTQWCSSNSRVGGTVFLELAMAYEASGRTQEAVKVYETLTKCRIDEIKNNAKKLLYGMLAFDFMKNEVKSEEFSRKQAKTTFIDTVGMANFASNFDDVYQTAYVDMDNGFYKQLTKSVVRSPREARQILLKAVGPGEVGRMRIVQALRAISRPFDDALQDELKRNAPAREPVAIMDGKPIVSESMQSQADAKIGSTDAQDFVLMGAAQMQANVNGEWRLQLLADKRGDGVKYFNTTVAWQRVDMERETFSSAGPAGFVTVQQNGAVLFNDKKRVLRRRSVEVSGGGVLAGLFGIKTGAAGAVRMPQQVMTVDSVLMLTRGVPSKRGAAATKEDDKDYFAVWRRVEPGTYSNPSNNRR